MVYQGLLYTDDGIRWYRGLGYTHGRTVVAIVAVVQQCQYRWVEMCRRRLVSNLNSDLTEVGVTIYPQFVLLSIYLALSLVLSLSRSTLVHWNQYVGTGQVLQAHMEFSVQYTTHTVYSVQYRVNNVHCTVYNVHGVHCTLYCTQYSEQYTLYIIRTWRTC